MQRRRFLYAVVAGSSLIAGCVSSDSGTGQFAPTATEQTTTELSTTTETPAETTTTETPVDQTPRTDQGETTTATTTPTAPTEPTDSQYESTEPTEIQYETTSVPFAISGNEVVETRQVPVEWIEQHDHAEEVLGRAEYIEMEGVVMTSLRSGEETVGGYHYYVIEVVALPDYVERVDEEIPDEVDGVPIKVVSGERPVVPEDETVIGTVTTNEDA